MFLPMSFGSYAGLLHIAGLALARLVVRTALKFVLRSSNRHGVFFNAKAKHLESRVET